MGIKKYLLCLVSALFMSSVVGCGGGEVDVAEKAEETASAEEYTTIDLATAATVKGKVSFEGDLPKARRLNMNAEPSCAALHNKPVYSNVVVPNENKTLRHVFVYVEKGLEDKVFETPKEPAVIDQKGCIYIPHMIGVQANQPIQILNSDPTTHNIHPLPKNNREWNESMAPGIPPKVKKFPREEVMIAVKCNVHPWMKSYIGVLKHPFFAVTGEDGSFEIKGLPPGEYTISAWHELLKKGTTSHKVTLSASDTKELDFTLKQAS